MGTIFIITGAVTVRAPGGPTRHYHNNNLRHLAGSKVGQYGVGWVYDDARPLSQSRILVYQGEREHVFKGRGGLNAFVKFLGMFHLELEG